MLRRLLVRLRRRPATVVVVGALRSGTNYLRFLLERNWACSVAFDAFGWKHAGVPIPGSAARLAYPDLPILFTVKEPHAFCRSLHRYHVAHGRNLRAPTEWGRFLREPLVLLDRDPARSPQYRFANPVQYWCFVYWNLAFLPEGRFRVHGLR